ncbi:MAG TPA: hypothetical protein QF469_09390, partial [Sphingomonas sanguinis]|uniref:hypothetical protein n=1 Tax=Sphingomonas sanguinis TaxID=33051 RepID=UPI002ABEB2D7|nr:hypothetical protein [Sphingomonas sanguinis]
MTRQRRRLAVDQPRPDPAASRRGILDEPAESQPELIADPLLQRLQRTQDRALGLLGAFRVRRAATWGSGAGAGSTLRAAFRVLGMPLAAATGLGALPVERLRPSQSI